MRRTVPLTSHLSLITAAALLLSSCAIAPIQPGADSLLVNAERTTAIATDTFDTFLKIEYDNREALRKLSPDIHAYAEVIRRNGVKWLKSARTITAAYKANRTPENKASLITSVAVLDTAIQESRKYIVKVDSLSMR